MALNGMRSPPTSLLPLYASSLLFSSLLSSSFSYKNRSHSTKEQEDVEVLCVRCVLDLCTMEKRRYNKGERGKRGDKGRRSISEERRRSVLHITAESQFDCSGDRKWQAHTQPTYRYVTSLTFYSSFHILNVFILFCFLFVLFILFNRIFWSTRICSVHCICC